MSFTHGRIGLRYRVRLWLARQGWIVKRMTGWTSGIDLYWDISQQLNHPLKFVIDVGAHKGETIEYFHDREPSCRIEAFEPISDTYACLSRRWGNHARKGQAYPLIQLHHMALADFEGSLQITLQKDSQSNSLRNTTNSISSFDQIEVVEVSTLDKQFLEETGMAPIDLLKIDVEGFEIKVLEGARGLLESNRLALVLCEFSVDPLDTEHTSISDLSHFLSQYKYQLVAFYDQVIWTNPARLGYGNVLFASSNC